MKSPHQGLHRPWSRFVRSGVLGALICGGLLGCATEAKYRAYLDQWVGVSELELVRHWGPPVQSYEVQGHKFLVFVSSRQTYMPDAPPIVSGVVVGGSIYNEHIWGSFGHVIELKCKTMFELDKGRVIASHWQGNDCAAP